MTYTIKAIPTTYNHVQFRSRLEARWAAFFDLCEWEWDYEPFDLDGWAPDFMLRLPITPVLVEVKPFDMVSLMEDAVKTGGGKVAMPDYEKALNPKHCNKHQVALAGSSPPFNEIPFPACIPLDPPVGAPYSCDDIIDALFVDDMELLWRQAGNIVQWNAANDDYDSQFKRIFKRRAA